MGTPQKFPSKIDLWQALLRWGIALFFLFQLRVIWPDDSIYTGLLLKIVLSAISVGAAASGLSTLYGTSYSVEDRYLVVRSGFLRRRIALDSITLIEPSSSFTFGPSCSSDQLEINHRGRSLFISPKDKRQFADALKSRAPQIRVVGID